MFLSKILALLCRKQFYRYFLQSFSTAQILDRHSNNCFEINGQQINKIAKRGETIKFKNLANLFIHIKVMMRFRTLLLI